MTTPTSNFGWAKPVVGADSDTWGTELNALADAVDAQVALYLLKSGGTLTGDLLFTDATYDIGKSGATRPRDIFASRNITTGSGIASTRGSGTSLAANGTYYTVLAAASFVSNATYLITIEPSSNNAGATWLVKTATLPAGTVNMISANDGFYTFTGQLDGSGNFQVKVTSNAPVTVTANALRIA